MGFISVWTKLHRGREPLKSEKFLDFSLELVGPIR
jgi:hypothetical protein